jgi:acetoin utilization protein AcuB
MRVREFMTTNPVTVHPDTTLPATAELMKKGGFRRLPVVNHNNQVIGIVTDRDVKQAMPSDATSLSIWEINYLVTKIKVSEIMSHPVQFVLEDATLEYAAEQMLKYNIGGLPVMHGDQLKGVITTTDVLRAFVGHRE